MSRAHQKNEQSQAVGSEGFMSINEAISWLGMGRSTLWRRMTDGVILGKKDGWRTKVCRKSVQDYIANLPDYNEV